MLSEGVNKICWKKKKKNWEKSRNFRYGSTEDFLSKGQNTLGGGGGFHIPRVLIGVSHDLTSSNFFKLFGKLGQWTYRSIISKFICIILLKIGLMSAVFRHVGIKQGLKERLNKWVRRINKFELQIRFVDILSGPQLHNYLTYSTHLELYHGSYLQTRNFHYMDRQGIQRNA